MARDATLDGLIGRLIWVGVRGAEPGEAVLERELEVCRGVGVGGVILFDVDVPSRNGARDSGCDEGEARRRAVRNVVSPEQVRRLVAHVRERLGEDVIVSIDQEGGAVARLGPSRGFPPTVSAIAYGAMDEVERRKAAATLAATVAAGGIDLNLAPCVDVAINPDGPGLGALGRSFGRDPSAVIACAAEQIDAMHAHGLACCVKHFPGHGSGAGDTHFGLVDVTETFVESDELAPYRALLGPDRAWREAPDAVMIGHVLHRGIDAERPASLSRAHVTGLLRERLGYDGLVVTDSLDMRAIADRFGAGEAAVLAIEAGCDVALEANNLSEVRPCPADRMHAALRASVDDGRLSVERVEAGAARLDRFLGTLRARRAAIGTRGQE